MGRFCGGRRAVYAKRLALPFLARCERGILVELNRPLRGKAEYEDDWEREGIWDEGKRGLTRRTLNVERRTLNARF
jgi:hypothetical protein